MQVRTFDAEFEFGKPIHVRAKEAMGRRRICSQPMNSGRSQPCGKSPSRGRNLKWTHPLDAPKASKQRELLVPRGIEPPRLASICSESHRISCKLEA